ncbi:MAG TPA: TadE/TadG family type IV pilus assembly protein [Anaerolineales bacterium]|nr:TadE/TadG family type IV pilus assembly protein [Anaerolineales bacterium]
MIKRFFKRIKKDRRGQSFLELSVVLIILALLLAGVVEFGFLMNSYFHLLDAARESSRAALSVEPFNVANGATYESFYYGAILQAVQIMDPIVLDPTHGDDIVVSVFSVANGFPIRYPQDGHGVSNPDGFSLCANFSGLEYWMDNQDPPIPYDNFPGLFDHKAEWEDSCSVQKTRIRTSQVQTILAKTPGAPATGMVMVEIIYGYPQLLKLPVLSMLGDPIPVYVYSVMPLPSAEPTPTNIIP